MGQHPIVYCPIAECAAGMIADPKCLESNPVIQCVACQHKFWTKFEIKDKKTRKWMKKNTKQCPECGEGIDKVGETCAHMKCRSCPDRILLGMHDCIPKRETGRTQRM